ncbi:unnamed protein product [Linum tenue]|uniref:Uncharacterized protein n=1 Tax=Linum tenue TaxID=586396 RepID=A0AAV0LKG0_9ROSI|nr:unnamed protein product [Linum tenue]
MAAMEKMRKLCRIGGGREGDDDYGGVDSSKLHNKERQPVDGFSELDGCLLDSQKNEIYMNEDEQHPSSSKVKETKDILKLLRAIDKIKVEVDQHKMHSSGYG